MTNEIIWKEQTIYCSYDNYLDALFVTFEKYPPLSYYEEWDDGIMVRKEADTDRVVGYTIRNISLKICEQYADDLMPT